MGSVGLKTASLYFYFKGIQAYFKRSLVKISAKQIMLPWTEIIIRLMLASFFGGLIGLERERKNWAAGLRTHMMVSVGACLIMLVSAYGFEEVLKGTNIALDPSRIAAQVVSGIGFIGAGTILFLKQGAIRGLTTASGLWTVAAIGLATGGGMYFAAAATTVIAIVILWALQPLERIYTKRFRPKTLRILLNHNAHALDSIVKIIRHPEAKVSSFSMEKTDEGFEVFIKFEEGDTASIEPILLQIQSLHTVHEISWE